MERGQVARHQIGRRRQHLHASLDRRQLAIKNRGEIAGQEYRVAEYALFLDDVALVHRQQATTSAGKIQANTSSSRPVRMEYRRGGRAAR